MLHTFMPDVISSTPRVAYAMRVEEARRGRGEDRIAVVRLADCTVFVVADGAGGVAGGAAAATAVCSALEAAASVTSDWSGWLLQRDRAMAASGLPGLAAVAVLSVSDDGVVNGASVGDCEAWVFGHGEPLALTDGQVRKPLLGAGDAVSVGFATKFRGTLVVASDGLWKYMSHERIAEAARMRPLESALAAMVAGVRLRSGALQDDVAIMICEVPGA